MGTVSYKKKAIKVLLKLPLQKASKFKMSFQLIASNNTQGLNIKPLAGRDGFRLRIGDYRAIYEVEGENINVLVLNIGARGDVYK